ncbi:hypothetical protein [Streptomyces sp. NPDC002172]
MQKFALSAVVLAGALTLFTGQTAGAAVPEHPKADTARTVPLSAAAEEVDIATAGTPDWSSSWECSTIAAAQGCFVTYGDHLWVKDTKPDGLAADVYWENYLWNGSSWVFWRNGRCENHLGSGHWGGCNKDFYEDSTSPNPVGGEGSEVCVWAEVTGDVGPGYCMLNDM